MEVLEGWFVYPFPVLKALVKNFHFIVTTEYM